MGTDTPLAVLSERPRLLYDYFKQLFAQVTNPPLDAIREELVTSMASTIGPEGNLLKPGPESCRQIGITYPIIDNDQLAKLRHVQIAGFRSVTLQMLYRPEEGGAGLAAALDQLCLQASEAVKAGNNILILSDRGVSRELAPIPSLLATAGVHHHLVREGARTRCALVLESGDAREVHHVALLIGYGAGAVNPYLAFERLDDLIRQHVLEGITHARAVSHYIKGLNKGILKVMSKMGISTLQSYCGAQIFEAIGLDQAFIDRYFTSTASRIGGVGIDVIAGGSPAAARARIPDALRRLARPRRRRRVPVAPRRRAASVQPRDGLQAPARDAIGPVRDLSRVHRPRERPEPQARHAARASRVQAGDARAARRGRAGRLDREALRDRRDVVRLDQPGRRTRRSPSR